ncbi:MAG: peptide chain release factor 3 [Bdellovibrionota bacterium]|nr:MAG: peptide chain release factor 3 [Bdellovibrionota bacterium]
MTTLSEQIASEVARRRTFAIISHPDAGKTTLTEKLLLYSGMLRTAGMVRARKHAQTTMSDWMALEQERGISITASAMQFVYKDAVINLLDTPGHQDFSEDTYRTLTAADCAVMVLDAAKGVEAQTRKLFAVCRLRGIPVITFINKLDLPAREPLDLLHEVEEVLGIASSPVNWPVGLGRAFVGVVDLTTHEVLRFRRSDQGGAQRAAMEHIALEDLASDPGTEPETVTKVREDMELLEGAGNKFDRAAFLAGKVTPVFFGSALTNFGVEPFFDALVSLAPAPKPTTIIRGAGEQSEVAPTDTTFTAFVFKIQSNMNPKHRDSMAFVRICSGRFERDMPVHHSRLDKDIRLSRSFTVMARDRDTVDYAYPGDIVGLTNPGIFALGDTISTAKEPVSVPPLPRFAPELVARIRPLDVMRKKAFDKGIEQLSAEGTIHLLYPYESPASNPMIAAVGQLQFEVCQYRLEDEYNVKVELTPLSYSQCFYLDGDPATFKRTQNAALAKDRFGKVLVLFSQEWERDYMAKHNPSHAFLPMAA